MSFENLTHEKTIRCEKSRSKSRSHRIFSLLSSAHLVSSPIHFSIEKMAYEPNASEAPGYQYLFNVATKGKNAIAGKEAVNFFMKSQLPVPTLKQVWSIASRGAAEMGYQEFNTALRLIALAQKGVALGPQTLDQTRGMQIPLPEFQGIEVPKAPQPSPSSSSGAAAAQSSSPVSWAIPSTAKANYAKLWEGVTKNGQGLMDGKEAALFLAKSGLNREALRTIWQLSDVSSDGKLDQTEFFIAMHLTMMNKKGASLPSSLPNELLQSAKMSQSSSGGGSSRSLLDLDASNSSMMNASAAAMRRPW